MAQPPVIIYGGTGGRGGDGGTGGAGGIGGGPIVNFSMSVTHATEEKLEKWLESPPKMTGKQHETEKLRSQGTGEWFLKDEKFIQWKDKPGVLWIEGPSGSGKSVLSSTVIKELFDKRAQFAAHPLAIAFFYFDFRNKETQSMEIALRQLILQLSAQTPDPYKLLDDQYNLSNGQKLPSYADLISLLLKLLHELGRTYVVLDALDECDSSNFQQLVGLVAELKTWAETPLHLFITSQTRTIFTESFKDTNHMVLRGHIIDKDIMLFIANELHTNFELQVWRPNATLITEKITQKSNGMFRLAACLLIELSHCPWGENEELDKTLERLPNDLYGIYDQFMLAIPMEYFSYMEAALRWIMFNQDNWGQGFTLAKLADAIAFDFSNVVHIYKPNRQEGNTHIIKKWLAGLIQVDYLSRIQLAHASVQDYLLSNHFKQEFRSDLSEGHSHAFICQSSLSYILYFADQPLQNRETDRLKYPLGTYVVTKWYKHLLKSDGQETLRGLATQLLQDGSTQYYALCCLNEIFEEDKEFSKLLWSNISQYPSPLVFCCREGYLKCALWLIENGADVHTVDGGASSLNVASYRGHADIIQLLLEKGANINLVDREYGSPLAAAYYGRNLDIVKLLLEKGADINLVGGAYGSPLAAASHRGDLDIVRLLLENGADINVTGGEYGSPLAAASYWGELDTVQLLLDKGANINLVDREYGSPLAAASYQGKLNIVQFLLENGANVNLVGGRYGSPLATAAYIGELNIVQFLLNKGANINLVGGEYGSALVAASLAGNFKIVHLLLREGANINLVGGEYGNALGAACYGNAPWIVKLLLEKGADISEAGGKYGSALATASASKYIIPPTGLVRFLLENGADIKSQGGRALKEAMENGYEDIVALLQEHGAMLDGEDNSLDSSRE